jgi:hypothetical protein
VTVAGAEAWPAPEAARRQPAPVIASVRPEPSPDEVVAITMAIELLWPKPVPAAAAASGRAGTWRFSGRWWSRPVPARRSRPWY